MSRFKITISDEIIASLHGPSWHRLSSFLEQRFTEGHAGGGRAVWWGRIGEHLHDGVTYTGDAPDDVIAVLQAVARGDDTDAVLDMLGFPSNPPPAPSSTTPEPGE